MPKTSAKLLNKFTRTDGCSFRGFLTTASIPTTSAGFMPIRIMNVLKPCFILEGDVVKAETGEHILMMEAPQPGSLYKAFRAVLVTHEFSWSRKGQLIDPVSHVLKDGFPINLGTIYAYFENPQDQAFEKLSGTQYQFYTGQNVQVGDTVGSKLIKKVTRVAGVNLVFAE